MRTDTLVQGYLRALSIAVRQTTRVGPFIAAYVPELASPWLNCAIPDDDADPTFAEIEALVRHYRDLVRVPRLEFLPSCSPKVQPALLDYGFVLEAEMPVMMCTEERLRAAGDPTGVGFAIATTETDVREFTELQHRVFGDPPPDEAAIARRHRLANDTGILLLARDQATGAPIGTAMTVQPIDGVTELVCVVVDPAYRRRGIAASLIYQLSHLVFARGNSTIFLAADNSDAERIYARVGFRAESTAIEMAMPAQ